MRLLGWLSATVAAVLAIAANSCTAPGQYGGPIPIDIGGLRGRLAFLCREGMNEQTQARCPDDGADSGEKDSEGW